MIYKIKNKNGTFSKGGMRPTFSKKGKVWPSKAAIMSHCALASWNSPIVDGIPACIRKVYGECTVIEIDDVNGGITETNFEEWYVNNRIKK